MMVMTRPMVVKEKSEPERMEHTVGQYMINPKLMVVMVEMKVMLDMICRG